MANPLVEQDALPRWAERLPPEQLWRAADLKGTKWRRAVPAEVQEELLSEASKQPNLLHEPGALLGCPLPSALKAWALELRTERLDGAGFVVLECPKASPLRAPHRRLLYAALGLALGTPIQRYGLLYEVQDQGGSYTEQAIPVSQTAAATGLHTDSSAWDCVPDFVGLLCERPSPFGGESVLVNAVAAHEWLREQRAESLVRLYSPYLRDLITPGVDKDLPRRRRNRFPIFADVQGKRPFLLRYMRYWIEKGHERLGEALPPAALAAFDNLDRALGRAEFQLRFRLEAGDMLWIDNRRLAHGREAYGSSPADGRLLWRMWLSRS